MRIEIHRTVCFEFTYVVVSYLFVARMFTYVHTCIHANTYVCQHMPWPQDDHQHHDDHRRGKNPPGAPCTDVQARTATSAVQTAAGQCWVAAVRIFCSREIGREVRYHSISRISNVRSHGCFHLFAFAGLFSVLGGSSYSGFRLRNLVLAHHKVSVPSKLRRPSRKSRKLAQTLRTPKSEIQNHLGLRKP